MTRDASNQSCEKARNVAERRVAQRRQAEEQVRNMEQLSLSAAPPEVSSRLLHELRVHQIELEMQNEELRTAQAEIEAGRARYSDLYDLAPVGYCTVSEQGLILEANLTAAMLLGVPRGALFRQPISRFILRGDQDGYYLHRKRLLETASTGSGQAGGAQEHELRLVKPDGSSFWAHLTSTTVPAEDGDSVCRIAISDITARRRVEEALRKQEKDLRESQRIARVGSWRLNVATEEVVWTEELYRMYGLDPSLPPPPYTEHAKLFVPESWERLSTALTHTRETGSPYTLELQTVREDGSHGWMWVHGEAEVDSTGKTVGLWGAAQDITEARDTAAQLRDLLAESEHARLTLLGLLEDHQRAEVALRESDEQYRGLIDNSPNIIFTMDLTGKLTFASHRAKELLGYESEEVINRSVLDFIPAEERLAAMEGIQKGMAGAGIKHFQTPMIKKSGERAWFECSFARLRRDGAVVGAQGTAVDITERKRAEDLLKRSEQDALRTAAQLRRVMDLNAHISEGLGLDRVMQAVYEQCAAVMPTDTFYIALYDETTGLATFPFFYKDGARREVPPRDVRTSPGLVAHAIAQRKTVYLPDATESSLHLVHQPGALTRSIIAVPLSLHGQILGVFSAQSAEPNVYTEEQVTTLEQLAGGIAVALENSHLYDSVSQGLEATLAALGRAAETRDPYTAGHQQRVTDLALAIASKLGFEADACRALRISGMLHDIGKLGVPAEILSKPNALSRIEFALIQAHSRNAYDILAGIPFPGPVAEIVLQHHERLDGSGYPNGISGDDILPEARVLAVADVVEAMASHRPYRPALGITAALDEIRSGRGARYDEQVVDACVALFESGEFAFDTA